MKKIILPILIFALLGGCASKSPKEIKISTPFDVKEASVVNKFGKNTIIGSALIRRGDGQSVNCSGGEVHLIPYTAYANSRMLEAYGSSNKGFKRVMPRGFNEVKFTPDTPEYYLIRKITQCNSQGFFTFKHVANGKYFVITDIVWMIGDKPEGGSLMQRVSVEGGVVLDIVVTP